MLASLFGVSTKPYARAVAIAGSSGGGYCMLGLDPVGHSSWGGYEFVGMWGGVTITMTGCGMAVNAREFWRPDAGNGRHAQCAACIAAGQINSVWSTVNVQSLKQNQKPISDPYANVPMPTSSSCDYYNFSQSCRPPSRRLALGGYCNGMYDSNGANVLLSQGTYFIKSGQFNISGGASVTGTELLSFYSARDGGNTYATFSISNGSNITLSAPTTATGNQPAGILFFGDRNAPASNTNSLSGFTTLNLTGAIYMPTQLSWGGWANSITGCYQLISLAL